MIPPTWMIEELERRRRQEREHQDRAQIRIELELPIEHDRRREPARRPGEPIVIEL